MALLTKLVSLQLILTIGFLSPNTAEAGLLSFLGFSKEEVSTTTTTHNAQTIPLPETAGAPVDLGGRGGAEVVVSDGALVSEVGPLGTQADIAQNEYPPSNEISVYVVHKGDSLPVIAKMFGVSVNTIMWANDIKKGEKLKEGRILTILPITGISYTVKKGDTLKSIAEEFKGDATDIALFNGIEGNKLVVGEKIIIPDAESPEPDSKVNLPVSHNNINKVKETKTRIDATGYFIRPVTGGLRTQGLHGKNGGGIDIARLPIGSPILAAAEGTVVLAKNGGWNGGYGNYVVIKHPNGTTTLYAHLNKATVTTGERVSQGDQIGEFGNSGNVFPRPTSQNPTAGAHLHFEVHGATNPLANNPNYGL